MSVDSMIRLLQGIHSAWFIRAWSYMYYKLPERASPLFVLASASEMSLAHAGGDIATDIAEKNQIKSFCVRARRI